MPTRVGTCGWQYDDWGDAFYGGAPKSSWLSEYAKTFDTVECDNAFYRLPSRDTFAKWAAALPDGFTMAVKASRFLTHVKRLVDPAEPVQRLLESCAGLHDRLGPILLQLPPNLRLELDRLDATLACFPSSVRVAVEPRHDSWWNDDVRRVLERRGAALVWADRLGKPITPLWRTTDWGYVRLHEGRARPWPRYGDAALRTWHTRIAETWPLCERSRGSLRERSNGSFRERSNESLRAGANGSLRDDVFVYFNNDPGAAAIRNARTFARIVDRVSVAS